MQHPELATPHAQHALATPANYPQQLTLLQHRLLMSAACVVLTLTICITCCDTLMFYSADCNLPTYLVSSITLDYQLLHLLGMLFDFLKVFAHIIVGCSLKCPYLWDERMPMRWYPYLWKGIIEGSSHFGLARFNSHSRSMQNSNKNQTDPNLVKFITPMNNCKEQFFQKCDCNAWNAV